MPLAIKTFNHHANAGETFFKAIGHPLVRDKLQDLVKLLRENKKVYAFDPEQNLSTFNALTGIQPQFFDGIFVQAIEQLTVSYGQQLPQLITQIVNTQADILFVPVFNDQKIRKQIQHLLPYNCKLITLECIKLENAMLVDAVNYLNPLNFVTNFALFSNNANLHTRIVTLNYWQSYQGNQPQLWCCLLDENGTTKQEFVLDLGQDNQCMVIDSRTLAQKYGLTDFTGQLFIHAIGKVNHPWLKYLLYRYQTHQQKASIISFTHDANAWPSTYYSGLPAPVGPNQSVVLWLQNPHPIAIPAQSIGLAKNGTDDFKYIDQSIPAYGTLAVPVADIIPSASWPEHIEIYAGKYLVRPRYEVIDDGQLKLLSHVNIEPESKTCSDEIKIVQEHIGKGYILTAPILPKAQYQQFMLPTPMNRKQTSLPLAALIYDSSGELRNKKQLGNLPRNHCIDSNINQLANSLSDHERGNIQLVYDFSQGGMADGWFHAIFRYQQTATGKITDTSFGAHLFNLPITFKDEPQSYSGNIPGLTTNLYLQLAFSDHKTYCHLIYPISNHWHPTSTTYLTLYSAKAEKIAQQLLHINANGNVHFFAEDLFSPAQIMNAGNGYIIIHDDSCRLFGYHGIMENNGLALDHLFGF